MKSRDGMKKFYVKKAVGLSLGLNPKRNRFGWLCRLGRRGVGESVRWPSTIGPKLLFAPHDAFELVPKPNLHSIYALSQQTLNPKP